MRILKFGGKSLESKEKMQNICKFIKNIYKNDKKIIVVVSAIGKTTDNLLQKAQEFVGDFSLSRELAVLLSTGETVSSAIFSMMLTSFGVPAKSYQGFQLNIETFGDYNNSKIAYINKSEILKSLDNNEVAIVSGFQGVNKNGEITTLGRGGSDTTAVAIASIFDHDVEIYSDFNGIFSGDPRLFNYKKINKINYDNMILLSKFGAKVLESRSCEIAKKYGIDIISKSSTDFNKKGTIVSDIESNVVSISNIDNLCKISIVYSDKTKINFISKIVINELKQINFYNLTIENNIISFCVSTNIKNEIIYTLSKKLNLLKN